MWTSVKQWNKYVLTERAIEEVGQGWNPRSRHWRCMEDLDELNKKNTKGLDGAWYKKANQDTTSQHQPAPAPVRWHILILILICFCNTTQTIEEN